LLKEAYYQIPPEQLEKKGPKTPPKGSIFAADFQPLILVFPETQARHQTALVGTRCLIAVKRYELAHGKPPENLTEAVKKAGMKEVPIDLFSGKEMKFTVVNGQPEVYSVGLDRKDDGGLVDWRTGKDPSDYIFRVGTLPQR
jgi:hypothetical protein